MAVATDEKIEKSTHLNYLMSRFRSMLSDGGHSASALMGEVQGEFNAFLGLMLDNVSNLILLAFLAKEFGFPQEFVVTRMVPGAAVGIVTGNLF